MKILVTFLAAVIGGAFASPALAAPAEFFGTTPQWALDAEDFERMEEGTVLRHGINWPALQRTEAEGQAIRNIYDDEFGRAAQHGIIILPFITNTPEWLRPDEDLPPIATTRQRNAWQNVLRLFAERYGKGGDFWSSPEFRLEYPGARPAPIRTWQIWNEPSSPASWDPRPDPQEYADLFLLAEEAIHEVNPRAKVMTAGNYYAPLNRAELADVYMKAMLKVAGMKAAVDYVALHPYAKSMGGVKFQIEEVRAALASINAEQKKLFITESGWSSEDKNGQQFTTLSGQAKKVRDLYTMTLANRTEWNLGGVYWYSFEDLPPGEQTCLFCAQTGLFYSNGQPKPAWDAFTGFID